jgi:transposase
MDEPECPGCREHLKRLAELEARVAELTRKLEEATRAGKRQAAPFRKGPPKPDPKKPGRKSGDAHGTHGHRPIPPGSVAERHEATLPEACPHCRGPLIETGTAEQFQTEIPRQPLIRQFTVHLGRCTDCGRPARGRHPLQTSDALGAAASQIGPDAQAAVALLHTQAGLSHGKVAAVFDAVFGIQLTRGASAQINGRAGTRLEPEYRRILASIRASKQLAADETGWRVGGHNAWLHVWVGDGATACAIDSQRSADALERVIGIDWSGVLSHDGYSTYDRFAHAIHQSCLAHVLRRARELLADASRGAVVFPRQLIALFTEAIHRRNQLGGRVESDAERERQRSGFDDRLLALIRRPRAVPAYTTLAKHLHRHLEQWFTFVFDPSVEPTNWRAEQAIRPAVVNRKVWGGNRTRAGADAQGVLMSVFETCRRHARSALDFVSGNLRAWGNRLLQSPTLLPGR